MIRLHYVYAIGLLLLLASGARAEQLLPLAVQDGRCEFVLPTEHTDDQFLLIVGSLAQSGGPFHLRITSEPTTAAARLPLSKSPADPLWQKHVKELAALQATARRQPAAAERFTPLKQPPKFKVFHLLVGDGDFANPSNYVAVTAELRGVGKHCQVYVDPIADAKILERTVADAIRTFDSDVWPNALGSALDVDRDGRFTIFFSGWLAKMQSGQVKLGGFVRGSDFFRDLAAPFGNRCDMMYLNTDLKPGPYLHTLMAHEYTHAVICSEHLFGDYLPGSPRLDEQSWLNEAIAHMVEDRRGASWANLDYRISAYLNSPAGYSLVVPDYYGARLWRDPGTRGCTYLFLRWCVDKYGQALLTRLVQSNLSGVENLETATQTRFADLFRSWSAAMFVAGSGIDIAGVSPLTGVNPRAPLASRLLCGPSFESLPLKGDGIEIKLAPTGVAYALLHSPGATQSSIKVACDRKADLQVSLIRLPRKMPRLTLQCIRETNSEIQLSLTCHHAGVTLEHVAWEKVVTQPDATGDTSFQPDAARAMVWTSQHGGGRNSPKRCDPCAARPHRDQGNGEGRGGPANQRLALSKSEE